MRHKLHCREQPQIAHRAGQFTQGGEHRVRCARAAPLSQKIASGSRRQERFDRRQPRPGWLHEPLLKNCFRIEEIRTWARSTG